MPYRSPKYPQLPSCSFELNTLNSFPVVSVNLSLRYHSLYGLRPLPECLVEPFPRLGWKAFSPFNEEGLIRIVNVGALIIRIGFWGFLKKL